MYITDILYHTVPSYSQVTLTFLHENLQYKSHKLYTPPTSVTWLQLLCKQANTGTSTVLIADTLIYAHTTFNTFQTCDISIGSLTLLVPEVGDFMELILLYCRPRDMYVSTYTSRLKIKVIFTWVRFNPKICYLAPIKTESSCPQTIMKSRGWETNLA